VIEGTGDNAALDGRYCHVRGVRRCYDREAAVRDTDARGNRMNRAALIVTLAVLVALSACHRAPHEAQPESAPAPVGTAPEAAPAVAASGNFGAPLPDGKMMPYADVMSKYSSDLSGVAFYFGNQSHPRVVETLGSYVANRKTNAFNKTDAEACERIALTALKEFKDKAQTLGGNAVINIHSYYKKNEISDPTSYECHSGFAAAGAAFKGTVVKLAK
jgi:uncharacterized protein YbjQ (UPF0145 family)